MAALSIRGIDDTLAARLKKEAASSNRSVNQVVLEILRSRMGLDKKKLSTTEYHDLDELFGRWSDDEYSAIQEELDSQRNIDEELWK